MVVGKSAIRAEYRRRAKLRQSEAGVVTVPGKPSKVRLHETVPQTDTGGRDEYSQARERTHVKELGKLHTYLRNKYGLNGIARFRGGCR
jgi:hypothetical protein